MKKTSDEKHAVKNLLLNAGKVYAYKHPIVKKNDKDFVFRQNAELCWRSVHRLVVQKIYMTIFLVSCTSLAVMKLIADGFFYVAFGVIVIVVIFAIALMRQRKQDINATAMMKGWNPTRKILVRLLRRRPLIHQEEVNAQEVVKIKIVQDPCGEEEREFNIVLDYVKKVLEGIAHRIAGDKVVFQINSHCDKHPKYDKEKELLDEICKGLGIQAIGWADCFQKAKARHGLIK
jgi:hypothetical protein